MSRLLRSPSRSDKGSPGRKRGRPSRAVELTLTVVSSTKLVHTHTSNGRYRTTTATGFGSNFATMGLDRLADGRLIPTGPCEASPWLLLTNADPTCIRELAGF